MGLGTKIKRGISNRLALARERRQLATEQRGREQAEYQEAYNRARLQRAKTEGRKAAYAKKRRGTSFIRTDGPDPFGLFEGQRKKKTATTTKKKSGSTTIVIQNGKAQVKRKKRSTQQPQKRGFNSKDYLDNLM